MSKTGEREKQIKIEQETKERKQMFSEQSRKKIEEAYRKVKEDLGDFMEPADQYIRSLPEAEAAAMHYLYASMPYSDIGNYPVETFLDFARHGVWLYKHNTYVRELPEELFLQYVLYHRVNEEEIRPCRSLFYQELKDQIEGKDAEKTALEVNYWCAGEVSYEAGDDRTLSALSVWQRGYGRCGEESVFTVNALRSAGIPARQVYAPYWSHCDDNHAWVEVWIDGTWHFLGACEPEPLLDLGWFEYAASRAMLVHSRRFDGRIESAGQEDADRKSEMEEVIGKDGMVVMENVLSRYADDVKKIEVTVVDEKGRPAAGISVWFEVFNYAAFRPIAQCRTDEHGKGSLSTGAGSLHLFAAGQGRYADEILDTRESRSCTLTLAKRLDCCPETEGWRDLDLIPPHDRAPLSKRPSPEQKEKGKERLALLRNKQENKRKEWVNPEREAFLSCLETKTSQERKLGEQLLETLTAKDQTDIRCTVLLDHLEGVLPYWNTVPEDIFVTALLNPRVDDEVLTEYRGWFQREISTEEQERYRKDPGRLWEKIQKEVRECLEQERSTVLTTPTACYRMRCGSGRSKRILFVAMARSFGIPARLCPEDGTVQYWKDGRFLSADPDRTKSAVLILHAENPKMWRYGLNWSITKLTEEQGFPLRLTDTGWDNGKREIHLENGIYRILTSVRLPNGTVHARECQILLSSGCRKEIALQLREEKLSEMLESLSLPEFPVRDLNGQEISSGILTEEGSHVLIWAGEGEEPTEHIFNEMLEEKERFTPWASRILLFVRSKQAWEHPLFAKVMETFPQIQVYEDDFEDHVPAVGRRLYVDHEKLPIIAVTKGRLNVIYGTSGYQVGLGDLLLRILEEETCYNR